MARRTRLDVRPVYRRFGRQEQAGYSSAIAAAEPKRNPDGKPTGGSLAREARRATLLRVTRWGYVIRWSRLGQKLTWFVRGARRSPEDGGNQPPRPLRLPPDPSQALANALADEIARQFDAWDSEAR